MVNRRRVGAYAVCIDGGSVLLTRLWERARAAGRWTLPGGGMRFGEHPEETLRRELYEETGLIGEVQELLDVRSHVLTPHGSHPGLQVVQFLYRVEANGVPRVVERGGSTVDAAWVAFDRLDTLPTVPLVHRGLELVR